MTGLAEFYAQSKWGARWGVVDTAHPTPHKGLDIAAPAGTPVPVLRGGQIVAKGISPVIGGWFTVKVGDNDFDTYCHQVVTGSVGQQAHPGESFSHVAGVNDAHGSAWTGPHTHYARSSTQTGWSVWPNLNPETVTVAEIERNTHMSFSIIKDATSATVWLQSLVSGRIAVVQSGYHLGLLRRVKVNDGGDSMLKGELDIVAGYLALINPPLAVDLAALVDKIDAADDDETAKILGAIGKIATGDPATIAAEVDKLLAGDFAAVPKAVLDMEAARLTS